MNNSKDTVKPKTTLAEEAVNVLHPAATALIEMLIKCQ